MFKVGTVIQYFEKTGIAFIKLENTISVGEKIKFVDKTVDIFEQIVESIQVGFNKLDFANRGSLIGVKTIQPVKVGNEVFKTN